MTAPLAPPPAAGSHPAPGRRRAASRAARAGLVAAAAAAAVAAVTTVALVDPNEPGHYPGCPFLALTGLYCPGCGSLRAVHALAHGDLGEALARNPLAVATAPLLLVLAAAWARRTITGRARARTAPAWLIWAFLAVVVLYTVLRNLPAGAWLAP